MPLININKSVTVNVDADAAWDILGTRFTDVAAWASSVEASVPNQDAVEIKGAPPVKGRYCEIPGYGTTTETFSDYSDKNRSFTFGVVAAKVPGFVKDAKNSFSVKPIDAHSCEVTSAMSANATGIMGALMGGMMKSKFSSTIDVILEDFKIYAETGKPSAAKAKMLAKVSA